MSYSSDGHNSPNRESPYPRDKTQASTLVKPMHIQAGRIFRRGGGSFEEQHNPPHALSSRARDVALRKEQRGQLQELLAIHLIIL
jgi:hypothetical protein